MSLGSLLVFLIACGGILLILAAWRCSHVLTHPPRKTPAVILAHGGPLDPREAGARSFRNLDAGEIAGSEEIWWVDGYRDDGPVLLVIHGWGDSRYGVLPWVPLLLPVCRAMVLADLNGHGESQQTGFSWGKRELPQLEQWVGRVREQAAGAGLVVMGLSLGANLTIRLAEKLPDAIQAVLLEAPIPGPRPVVDQMLRVSGLPGWGFGALFSFLLRRQCGVAGQDLLNPATAQVRVPMLVLAGDADRFCSAEEARAIAGAAKSGQCRIFSGAGHLESGCLQPELYRQVASEFLSECTGR